MSWLQIACSCDKSLGVGILGFAELFHKRSPDLVLVLGDRYEILAAVSACQYLQFRSATSMAVRY